MEDNIIILEDDLGNQVEFAVIDVYELNDNTYFAMVEGVEDGNEESDEVPIMKADKTDTDDAELITVTDEDELQAAFNEFLRRDEEGIEEQTYPRRKEFSQNINNSVYARLTGRFPGDNTFYTAHKLILTNFNKENLESPLTYTYVVGREDKNGNPDPEHSSEEMQFTIYPSNYQPRIYHTTDQKY